MGGAPSYSCIYRHSIVTSTVTSTVSSRGRILEWAGGIYLTALRARLTAYWKNGDAHLFSYRKLRLGGDGETTRRQLLQFVYKLVTERKGQNAFPIGDVVPGWFGQIVRGQVSAVSQTDLEVLLLKGSWSCSSEGLVEDIRRHPLTHATHACVATCVPSR